MPQRSNKPLAPKLLLLSSVLMALTSLLSLSFFAMPRQTRYRYLTGDDSLTLKDVELADPIAIADMDWPNDYTRDFARLILAALEKNGYVDANHGAWSEYRINLSPLIREVVPKAMPAKEFREFAGELLRDPTTAKLFGKLDAGMGGYIHVVHAGPGEVYALASVLAKHATFNPKDLLQVKPEADKLDELPAGNNPFVPKLELEVLRRAYAVAPIKEDGSRDLAQLKFASEEANIKIQANQERASVAVLCASMIAGLGAFVAYKKRQDALQTSGYDVDPCYKRITASTASPRLIAD